MAMNSTWVVDGHFATLSYHQLRGKLDLLDPARGLHDLRWGDRMLSAARTLLGLSFETRTPLNPQLLLEAYARQTDLVVSYATSPQRDVGIQVYWRALQHEALGIVVPVLDMQASVQTALLDSMPTVYTYNVAHARELWRPRDEHARDWNQVWRVGQPSFLLDGPSHPGCWLFKLDQVQRDGATTEPGTEPLSLLVMVQPRDLHLGRAIVDPAEPQRVAIVCQLLHEHLEKGVIRRVWQRAAILDSSRDRDVAGELYREFAETEPSLTV
ncbi:MAG: hypothetical protein K2Y37_10210 [Pirellulales bacterium]|nr:hypothetical protein [Pirellulales bacterium]